LSLVSAVFLLFAAGSIPVSSRSASTPGQEQRGLGIAANPDRQTAATNQANPTARRPALVLQTGITSPAGNIAFSPDGRLLATMSVYGGAIRLWELATGRELRTLNLGERSFTTSSMSSCFSFIAGGRQLVSVSAGRVKFWDVETGRELRELLLPDSKDLMFMTLSRDGRLLAAASMVSNEIRLWETGTGQALGPFSLKDESGTILSIAFDPAGSQLAAVFRRYDGKVTSEVSEVKLWDVATGREARTIKVSTIKRPAIRPGTAAITETEMKRGITFSPDGRVIGVVIRDETFNQNVGGPGLPTQRITGRENTVRLWDAATGRELQTIAVSDNRVEAVDAFFDVSKNFAIGPDGKTLAAAGNDRTLKLFEAETGRHLNTLKGHAGEIICVAFSADGRMVATSGLDDQVRLWETETGRELLALASSALPIESVAFSADGRQLTAAGRVVNVWDLSSGSASRAALLPEVKKDFRHRARTIFSRDGRLVAVADSATPTVKLLETGAGREVGRFSIPAGRELGGGAFSPDGRLLALADKVEERVKAPDNAPAQQSQQSRPPTSQKDLQEEALKRMQQIARNPAAMARLQDIQKRIEEAAARGEMGKVMEISQEMMQNMGMALGATPQNSIRLWDVAAGRELRALPGASDAFHAGQTPIAFSPDGRQLAVAGIASVKLWDVAAGREACSLAAGRSMRTSSLAWSPDGRLLASGHWETRAGINLLSMSQNLGRVPFDSLYDNSVKIWDASTGQELRNLTGHTGFITAVVFSPDGRLLASGSDDSTIRLWDVSSGQLLHTLTGHTLPVGSLDFSPDSKLLVSGSEDGSTRLWKAQTGELLATLVSLNKGADWLVVTPDGLFDGSPAAWSQILWRFSDNIFNVAPVEIFFSEFYYPGLFADIMAGKNPKAPQDISQKDRRQPRLSLTLAGGQAPGEAVSTRNLAVKITISEAAAGAQDIRLFRNGSLVKVWRGDVLKGQPATTLEATVPLVAGENRLTAYAFNRDNVKSADARLDVTGAPSLKRAGTAYVLAIGINSYANTQYNLKYAVADARAFGEEFQRQQSRLGRFEHVEVVSLFDAAATKANIMLALRRLAGAGTGALPAGAPGSLEKLNPAQPEDAVVIYFAGHGTAQRQRFYLIPHDLGYDGERTRLTTEGLESILKHSISDQELEQAVESLDAAHLLMVIDACNSGQALEAEEKRRGPMNSKGLAQLAYEKGMYILTAAQSYQAALEAAQLGHGLLTYALVEEGLKSPQADAAPRDGQVVAREWLDYATERVPRMQMEKIKEARSLGLQITFAEGDAPKAASGSQGLQRPRVFYRREIEAQPLVIARP
jgi:WD40 repeat protein/uncharacterized caspase-like protein